MSGEFEAAGTAIEGALIAKAVEGKGSDATGGHSGTCLNCEAPVTGSYCNNCGQPLHIHRSIAAFWHDILHGVLHFEGKFWRTIPLLAWRPGDLTRRYIHGQRARFISPMALFLFSVFMMFAVFSLLGDPFSSVGAGVTDKNARAGIITEMGDLDAQIMTKTAELRNATGAKKAKLEQDILGLKKARNIMSSLTGGELLYPDVDLGVGPQSTIKISPSDLQEMQSGLDDIKDGNVLNEGSSISTGSPGIDKWLGGSLKKMEANPDLLLYKLKANGYKFAWLLIPISLPFVWLTLLGRRGLHFYDHAVFTTYSISFMSLLFIGCALLAAVGVTESIWVLLLIFYPPFHMYRQLRHAYSMSRPEAFIRTSFLLLFTIISLTFFFTTLLTLGVLG